MTMNGCTGNFFNSIAIEKGATSGVTVTITIYNGCSISAGNQIYQQTGTAVPDGSGFQTLPLSGGTGTLAFTSGNEYTFRFQFSSSTTFFRDNFNGYSLGCFFLAGGGGLNWDASFMVFTAATAPVEMTKFNASPTNEGILLNWQTVSEWQNEGFEIEHSMNGREWQLINFTKGSGSSFETHDYSYLHKNPLAGSNFYRLKQMDYDGNFEYSNVISIDLANGGHQLTISPNPTSTGQFTINFSDSNFESGELEIYDSVGRMVRTQNISINNTEIQTEDLPKGIYLVNLEVDGQRFLERVIIQ